MFLHPTSATPIFSDGVLQLTLHGIMDAARVVPAAAPDFFTNDLRFFTAYDRFSCSLTERKPIKKNGRTIGPVLFYFSKI
jgi:hypothetical protein